MDAVRPLTCAVISDEGFGLHAALAKSINKMENFNYHPPAAKQRSNILTHGKTDGENTYDCPVLATEK